MTTTREQRMDLDGIGITKYWVRMFGVDEFDITDTTDLDITGTFSIGFQIQLIADPVVPTNFILFTKGHPTLPASGGAFSAECVDGFLKVWLHDANATNSLVHISALPVLKSALVHDFTITWNPATDTFKVYRDRVEITMNIVTGGTNHATVGAMGNIQTNASPLVWGQGTGKTGYTGKVDHFLVSNAELTSHEVFLHFDPIKFAGTYPSTGTILMTSDSSGTYEMYTITRGGEDPTLLASNAGTEAFPIWSADGAYLAFIVGTTAYYANSGGGGITSAATVLGAAAFSWVPDSKAILYRSSLNFELLPIITGGVAVTRSYSANTAGFTNSGNNSSCWHPTNVRRFIGSGFQFSGTTIQIIRQVTLTADYGVLTGAAYSTLYSITTSDSAGIIDMKYSKDGNWILFSVRTSAAAKYEVNRIPAAGGAAVPLTTGGTYDSRFVDTIPLIYSLFTTGTTGVLELLPVSTELYSQIVADGDPIIYFKAGDIVAPTGLTSGTTYYVRKQGSPNISLHLTAPDAVSGDNAIAVGTPSVGSHILSYKDGVIYQQNSNGKWQFYIMNLDGSNKVNISNNAFNDNNGSWKP